LAGLFVAPTARTIGKNNFAAGFNEAKHVEWVNEKRGLDRQIRVALTYGITDSFEIYGSYFNNLLSAPRAPKLDNEPFVEYGFKWQLAKES